MTILALPPTPVDEVPQPADVTRVGEPSDEAILHGISWETYERIREETDAAGQVVYITYDQGRMTLMSPLPEHETWCAMLAQMVGLMARELRIPMRSLRSTTWKRQDRGRGLEADECYYVQNERVVRGKRHLDLARDPPPDLAFESERTRRAEGKLGVYAALGVPELWRYDGTNLSAVVLQRDAAGQPSYVPTATSVAFPFLAVADLEPFLARTFDPAVDETTLLLEFRDWVVATLKPNA
jgi:Uma2 family endonuclease